MNKHRWNATLLLACACWGAAGQTRIDLSRQGKLGSGTILPSQCIVGQIFFKTDVPVGANLYGCVPPGIWAVMGGAVYDGVLFPGAGVPYSTGSSWGTSYTIGTNPDNLLQLDGSGQLPPVSAALLTNFPILNQDTTGKSGGLTAPYIDWNATSGGAFILNKPSVFPPVFPGPNTLGGVKSIACSGSDKIRAIGTDGVPVCSTDQTSSGGTGDVGTITSSSVDSEIALFSGTSGKMLKRAAGSGIAKLTIGVLGTAIPGTDYAPATSGSAPLKADGSGGTAGATATDIKGLWSGSCNSATYLRGDGVCSSLAGGNTAPGGSAGQIQVNLDGTSLGGVDSQGSGSKVQMAAGSPGDAGTIVVYDSLGNAIAGGCSISGKSLVCGSGTESHGITLPELAANGANKFSLYGADNQSADGCVVLPVGPSSTGQVMQDSGSTANMTDGAVCRVLQWATLTGGGTVNSVNVSAPAALTAIGGPVTTTGTIALAWATGQSSGKVIGTCGSGTTFGPCSLTPTDIPQLAPANMPGFGGDVSTSPGSTSTALATVNANTGSCGDSSHVCQISADAKGRILSAMPVSIAGSGGGSGLSNPYVQSFACTSSPTTITAAAHLQGMFPLIKFRDANNLPTQADMVTLASNGDITIACGVLPTAITAYISGAVGSNANASVAFPSSLAPVLPSDSHGFDSADVELQVWDSSTPRRLMFPDSFSVDTTTFDVTMTFHTPQQGLAIIAAR